MFNILFMMLKILVVFLIHVILSDYGLVFTFFSFYYAKRMQLSVYLGYLQLLQNAVILKFTRGCIVRLLIKPLPS